VMINEDEWQQRRGSDEWLLETGYGWVMCDSLKQKQRRHLDTNPRTTALTHQLSRCLIPTAVLDLTHRSVLFQSAQRCEHVESSQPACYVVLCPLPFAVSKCILYLHTGTNNIILH
jgi:hypothetical protein